MLVYLQGRMVLKEQGFGSGSGSVSGSVLDPYSIGPLDPDPDPYPDPGGQK